MKEILQHSTGVNLRDVMLCEISESVKDRHCMILLTQGVTYSQTHGSREQNAGFQGLGERGREMNGESFNGCRGSLTEDE